MIDFNDLELQVSNIKIHAITNHVNRMQYIRNMQIVIHEISISVLDTKHHFRN